MSVAAPPPPSPVPPREGTPVDLVRWIFGVHNSHDPHTVGQVVATDAVVRVPSRTLRGRDEVVGYFEELFAALPDAAFTLLALAGDGETVFARWRLTGTHRGAPFEGLEPAGSRLDIDGIDQFTIRDQAVVANVVVFDRMQVLRGMGLLPTEGSRLDVGLRVARNVLARRRTQR